MDCSEYLLAKKILPASIQEWIFDESNSGFSQSLKQKHHLRFLNLIKNPAAFACDLFWATLAGENPYLEAFSLVSQKWNPVTVRYTALNNEKSPPQ